MDLRTRVLQDWDAGVHAKAVAGTYRVSRAWVNRLVQRRLSPQFLACRVAITSRGSLTSVK